MSDSETVEFGAHTYVVGKSGVGRQMRIARLLGSELAKDGIYMGACRLCDAVESIDGVPCPKLATPEQFEKMAERLEDAFPALVAALKRVNGEDISEAEGIETAKN